jgi:DNA-binding PadR family transcriptional regulator
LGVREGLLALLESEPRHGYGLKLEFEAATGGAWDLNVGQVYGALQKLEQDGLVSLDGEDDNGRKSYALTAAGRERLAEWFLHEPVRRKVESRDELTLKVLLAARAGIAGPREVLAAQRNATLAELQARTREKAELGPRAALEQIVHVDRVILHCRAEIDWLDLVEQRLDELEAKGDKS